MKLIISKDGIKREIEDPFAICCGMNDLDRLIRELQKQRAGMLDATYGWFRVDLTHPDLNPSVNTPPLKWTDR